MLISFQKYCASISGYKSNLKVEAVTHCIRFWHTALILPVIKDSIMQIIEMSSTTLDWKRLTFGFIELIPVLRFFPP